MSRNQDRRETKFKKQNGRCWWCGGVMSRVQVTLHDPEFATFEHLTRKRDGGNGKPHNVVLAHRRCNSQREKGTAQPFAEAGAE